jgi:hypothetical protein
MDGDYMPVEVPDDVLKMTTKCRHKFSCLTSDQCGKHKICEVERIMGTNVIFLKDTQQAQCPYRLAFDYSQICTCPTHYAMKKKDLSWDENGVNLPELKRQKTEERQLKILKKDLSWDENGVNLPELKRQKTEERQLKILRKKKSI